MMIRRRFFLFVFSVVALLLPLRSQVIPGIDVLKANEFAPLVGRRIGIITNQTGVSRDGRSTIEVLRAAPNVSVRAIFTPEHGFRGTSERDTIPDTVYAATRLPMYSLYGKTRRPTENMLKGLNALVYDIQDVGVRHYTYITTLAYCLEEAAKHKIKFFVLDRPVMINGSIVEGDVLPDSIRSFVGYLSIPTRYGMTPGELARYYNEEGKIGCDLEVIKMEGWRRTMSYDETGLRWVNPSPNIRRLDQAILYSGLGCLEATNLSVGRGTDHPFEYYGAPYLDGVRLAQELNRAGIAGLKASPVKFTPQASTFSGQECDGVKLEITSRSQLRTSEALVKMSILLKQLAPEWNYHTETFATLVGSDSIIHGLDRGLPAEEILKVFSKKIEQFQSIRSKYLLY